MSKAEGYRVLINSPEGLQEPRGENHEKIAQQNADAITSNFDTRMEELEQAGVLDGIKIHTRMRFRSSLFIDGDADKIERLKNHLKENNIGNLCENFEFQSSPNYS